MPIFFLLVGVFLIVVAINDKMKDLGDLVKQDFSLGKGGFAPWVIIVFVIGSLGYVKTLKPVANSFIVLVVVVMLLSNKGFFDKFQSALKVK